MNGSSNDAIAQRVSPEKVAEVQRLDSTLAARVRYSQMVRRPVPTEQITALIQAARLLAEYEAPWPSGMKQVVDGFSSICQGR